jgi:hypothetical protein
VGLGFIKAEPKVIKALTEVCDQFSGKNGRIKGNTYLELLLFPFERFVLLAKQSHSSTVRRFQ